MKKTLLLGLLCASIIGLNGCVSRTFEAGELMSLSDVRFAQTRFKRGRSCSNYLFPMKIPFVEGWVGIPLGGEARTLSAIQNGRINKVQFMEHTSEWYFILGKECIDIYGE